jgi:DNA replication protein DnaC
MDERKTGDVMRMLVEPELLIWDDFGAERWSTDFAPGLIFTVLESRRGRSDLFTSNHPIERVETKSEHGARIASRLSRCYQMCMTGPDRRPKQNRA